MINRRQVLGSLLGALALSQGTVRAQDRGGVLVIGSTGRMGSRFIAQLPDSAGPVTAFVRPTSNPHPARRPGCHLCGGRRLGCGVRRGGGPLGPPTGGPDFRPEPAGTAPHALRGRSPARG